MEGKGTVCVTGGTGFVASWLTMRLLDYGYSVHTTVRSHPEHKRDISHLTTLPGATERLRIFQADLSEPESFDTAIKGCVGVFHVAAPTDFEKEPEEVVTERSINGTLGILKACLKYSKTVKRVVYTSGLSAVVFNNKSVDIMNESFWSDVGCIKELKSSRVSCFISKTRTEKIAIEFAQQHTLDLITIIPSFIVGPFIGPKIPDSVHLLLAMVRGEREQYKRLLNTSMVHIDDVVGAHIFLLEYPEAKGRYICSSDTITIEEMSRFLSAKYPEFPIPTIESLKHITGHKIPCLSSEKLLDSGFIFKYGIDEMFDGAIKCCKEKGYF